MKGRSRIPRKAVVLLSGGMDSATALYYAASKGYDCRCLIFDYGQRHKKEIVLAKRIARARGVPYEVVSFRMPWKGSALLDGSIAVPKGRRIGKGIPSTYVPSRNTVFLSFGVSYAEAIGAPAVFIGANAVDYSGYPDCRPRHYRIFNELIRFGTKAGVEKRRMEVVAPLIDMTKAEIVKLGRRLGVPHELTWSCYSGGKRPCLKCDSCVLRAKGFRQAGIKDPLVER
ncbi:MAG: 7-cyano-7-deazaguanine synthase QueC [Candidatus Omnitrophota bacterium]